jgi:predicted membrane protein
MLYSFDTTQFNIFASLGLFVALFLIGYMTEKISSGAFLFISAWCLLSFGILMTASTLLFIPFVIPTSIFIMYLGIGKIMRCIAEKKAEVKAARG